MTEELYFQPPGAGPRCSTPQSSRLREHRFRLGHEQWTQPEGYQRLAESVREVFLESEAGDPAMARARAMAHVVAHCPVTIEAESPLLGRWFDAAPLSCDNVLT